MKDAVATMGAILPDDAGGRDAVHVAVFSAVAENTVFPGQRVALVGEATQDAIVRGVVGEAIGIVDPFLTDPVFAGSRFWVYLNPRTITGLSHQWTHPAFEETAATYAPPSDKLASEQWLMRFCGGPDLPGYDKIMEFATARADGDGDEPEPDSLYINAEATGEIPPEFWTHVEVVLGRPIKGRRAEYFRCGC